MSINSEVSICNLALNHLGNYGSVNDIQTPKTDKEKIFALTYSLTRQTILKTLMPNFALDRRVVSKKSSAGPFGYQYGYEYPNDCLKVLGVGNVDEKLGNRITIEGNTIYTDEDYPEGMPIRFIRDVTDVNAMSPEFKKTFSVVLADDVAMPITQDPQKKQLMHQRAMEEMANLSALNAQENLPIRRSESRFRAARSFEPAHNRSKK